MFWERGGGILSHVSVLSYPVRIGQKLIMGSFELKLKVFVMTKAVLNRDICFIKLVIVWREHRYFSLNNTSHGSTCPPPHMIGNNFVFL